LARPPIKEELVAEVRRTLEPKYVDKHPFMQLLYRGKLTRKQLQAWVINRFYLQNNITSKDAAIVSNCPVPEVRRIWLSRTLRREGMGDTVGDVDGWLEFAEAAGLRRETVRAARCLPGVRFAVEGLVSFARKSTWLEGVATSLYEVPAKSELVQRTSALKRHYGWIRPEGMKFFVSRIARIERDADTVVDLIATYTKDRTSRQSALKAALYMSDVVWSIHDAIYMNYVAVDSLLSASV
jgi:pyrroloquinoline-quinone synthase